MYIIIFYILLELSKILNNKEIALQQKNKNSTNKKF